MKYYCSIKLNPSKTFSLSELGQNSGNSSKDKILVSYFSIDDEEASSFSTSQLTFMSMICLVISMAINNSLSRVSIFSFLIFSNSFSSTDRFLSMVFSLFFFASDYSLVTSSIFSSVITCCCFEYKTSFVTSF